MTLIRLDEEVSLEAIVKAMHEVLTGSDRAVAIVAGSLLEMALTNTLKRFLLPDKKITKEFFRPDGPIGAFATKIRLGKVLGVYGSPAYKDFITIKNISNEFAHRIDLNGFENPQVKDWTRNLYLCDRYCADANDPLPPPFSKDIPIADLPFWIGLPDRDKKLKSPRQRYTYQFKSCCSD